MINVGIVGLGFMGQMHFNCHRKNPKARVVAISDLAPEKLAGDWSSIRGNISDANSGAVDLAGVKKYKRPESLIRDPGVDLVDITLPSYLHHKYTIKALEANKNVLCEKPMTLKLQQARRVLDAAAASKGKFMVAHCIRFWPEYAWTKKALEEKRYGAVKLAKFTRLSPTPAWSWDNWLMVEPRSGGAVVDLHIHDTDYVNYLFGKPEAVASRGIREAVSTGWDYIATSYSYPDIPCVWAEGGWLFQASFPFTMAFTIRCEQATIEYSLGKTPTLAVHKSDGSAEHPQPGGGGGGDGYAREIDYFLDCIEKGIDPAIVTPQAAYDAIEVTLAEVKSLERGGRSIRVK